METIDDCRKFLQDLNNAVKRKTIETEENCLEFPGNVGEKASHHHIGWPFIQPYTSTSFVIKTNGIYLCNKYIYIHRLCTGIRGNAISNYLVSLL
jgi:hypothetical protein